MMKEEEVVIQNGILRDEGGFITRIPPGPPYNCLILFSSPIAPKFFLVLENPIKLDGVGPVDNRLSTD